MGSLGKSGDYSSILLAVCTLAIAGCGQGGGGNAANPSKATVIDTTPKNNEKQIALNSTIEARFSQPMDPDSLSVTSVFVSRKGSQVAGTVTYDSTSNTVQFTPSQPLDSYTIHTVTLTGSIQDTEGKYFIPYSWSFVTEDATAPTVIEVLPLKDVHLVPLDSLVKATFSEEMNPQTIDNSSFFLTANGQNIPGIVSYVEGSQTAVFTPDSPLPTFTEITATLTTEIKDLEGNSLNENNAWQFKTVYPQNPEITAVTPLDQAQNVPLIDPVTNLPIQIEAHFSVSMDPLTINSSTFQVRDNHNLLVDGEITYIDSENDHVAKFSPSGTYSVLEMGRVYTITLSGIKDPYENPLFGNYGGNYIWSFTTPSGVGIPQLLSNSEQVVEPQIVFDPVHKLFHAVWQQWSEATQTYHLFATSFAHNPDINNAVEISDKDHPSPVGGLGMNPKLAVGPNGEVFVTWVQFISGENANSVWFNENLGSGWGIPQVLDQDVSTTNTPQIAVGSNGNPCVVWSQILTATGGIKESVLFTQRIVTQGIGNVWQTPIAIEVPTTAAGQGLAGHAIDPRIQVDSNNNIIVTFIQQNITYWSWINGAWSGQVDPFYSLLVTETAMGFGNSWQILDNSNVLTGDATNSVLRLDSAGNAFIVYQQVGPTPLSYDIYMNYRPVSSSWGYQTLVEAGTTLLSNKFPSVAKDPISGNLLIAWDQEDISNGNGGVLRGNVVFKSISPNGAAGPNVYLDNDGSNFALDASSRPELEVTPSGITYITFVQREAKDGEPEWNWSSRLYLSKLDLAGIWSAPVAVDLASDSYFVSASYGKGQVAFSEYEEPYFVFEETLPPNYGYQVFMNSVH